MWKEKVRGVNCYQVYMEYRNINSIDVILYLYLVYYKVAL